jgi:hypothetical protein
MVGAVLGAATYGSFRAVSGFDVGLVALFVGFIVGKAVHLGARERGGVRYQLLAVALTYLAVGASYAPLVAAQGGDASIVEAMLALPVAQATSSVVSAVILALALVQAWRMNRGSGLVVTGPYRIAAAGARDI